MQRSRLKKRRRPASAYPDSRWCFLGWLQLLPLFCLCYSCTPSLPHSPICNLCPPGSSVVLVSLGPTKAEGSYGWLHTHTLFPHVFLVAWTGVALLHNLSSACVPVPQTDMNHCSSPPFMTSNICLQQKKMNPILKHQIGPEKWLQRKNSTFVTTVLMTQISISKFFINRIIHSMYSYTSFGLTNFFQFLCMGKGTGLYQDAHTSSR